MCWRDVCVTSDLCNSRRGCWPQRARTAWWHHRGWPRWVWPRYPGLCPLSWSQWSRPPSPDLTEHKKETWHTRLKKLCCPLCCPVYSVLSATCFSALACVSVWPRDSAAMKAVVTPLAHRMAAWITSTLPLVRAPRPTAATAARKPTTVACVWGGRTVQGGIQSIDLSMYIFCPYIWLPTCFYICLS